MTHKTRSSPARRSQPKLRRVLKRLLSASREVVGEFAGYLPQGERIASLGICCPGPLDHVAGVLINPVNLPKFAGVALAQMIAERLDMPVSMEHDAKASGLGEFYYGAGRHEHSMVFTVIGTGVGAAIIDHGRLIRGVQNSAGEIGHATVDRDGEWCACGSRGCLETYISGPWLARRYQRLLEQEKRPHSAPAAPITGETVACLAQEGHPLALEIMNDAGEALGIAVATMAMTLDIELYVFGGSVPKCGDTLLEPARRTVPRYCFRPSDRACGWSSPSLAMTAPY